MSQRIVAVLQARMTSSRLPGKVLTDLGGRPMLAVQLERLARSQTLDGICVATTSLPTDDPVEDLVRSLGLPCHRGSEDDVLARMLDAARSVAADVVVRVTGDCPMIDPTIVDACVLGYAAGDVDYCSNTIDRTFPRGLDNEVVATEVLADVAARSDDAADHEHVTIHVYEHPDRYRLRSIKAVGRLARPELRWTVDTDDDLAFVRAVVAELGTDFSSIDAIELLDERPDLAAINAHIVQKAPRPTT